MKLHFSLRAGQDVDRLFNFLIENEASIQTADSAIEAIREGALSLLRQPESGVSLNDGTRRQELYIPFGRHNYRLRYIVDYDQQVIRVLRIWHSREKDA